MTLHEYRLSSMPEQIELLWEKGIWLACRTNPPYHMTLYQVDGFYVEVYYHSGMERIESIKPFNSLRPLEPYLEEIDITQLLPG